MKQNTNIFFILTISLFFTSYVSLTAQGLSVNEYKKALWMTTRFYGGQRSGDNNWLVYNYLPSGLNASLTGKCFINDQDIDGYNLSGGWHDCGDHVKFGQTEFYSAYMLLKGYAEFPAGYDDYYSYNYSGYISSGKWNWEENSHNPNGIPDILDEVKHATDFFIKCTQSSNVFYYQVGQGVPDHVFWYTAVKMQTLTKTNGGQTRTVYKNPADASMASFCGATLALMSRVYRKFDPPYADLCLQHARYAYDYAKAHPGVTGAGDGSFYGPNDNWKDDYASLCAELFWATGTTTYKNEALAFSVAYDAGFGADIYGKNYGFDYSNNGDIAIYNLAKLGKSNALSVLENIVNIHYFGNKRADGQFNGGNQDWGPLRYNANTAFIVALWQKLKGTSAIPNKYIYDNIDYILGKNTSGQSFIVGFGTKSPQFPHHRNVYLCDNNPWALSSPVMLIPEKNKQFGLMVGGTRNVTSYTDAFSNYQMNEGGIDYNACLVGILGYLNSVLAPVDTLKFGIPNTSNLTVNHDTICNAGIASLSVVSSNEYDWYDAKTGGNKVASGNIFTPYITSSQTYYVQPQTTPLSIIGKSTQGTGEKWSIGNLDFGGTDKKNLITVYSSIVLESVAVYVENPGTSVNIRLLQGSTVVYSTVQNNVGSGKQTIYLNWNLQPGTYLIDADGTNNSLIYEASGATFPYEASGVVKFENNEEWQLTWYGFFYDLKFVSNTVSTSERLPVYAIINPANCMPTNLETNNNQNQINCWINNDEKILVIQSTEDIQQVMIFNATGQLIMLKQNPENSIEIEHLSPDIFYIKIQTTNNSIVKQIIHIK